MDFLPEAFKAKDVLSEILQNREVDVKYRIAVARDLLDRAGYKPGKAATGKEENPYDELPADELKALLDWREEDG